MGSVNINIELADLDANVQGVIDAATHLATVWSNFVEKISSVDAAQEEKISRLKETIEHLSPFVHVPDEGPFLDEDVEPTRG